MTITETVAVPRTIADAVERGETELFLEGLDTAVLAERAQVYFNRTRRFYSPAVSHYHAKLGYSPAGSRELFTFVRQFLALSAAYDELGLPGMLSIPEKADNDGWHGFLIQTRDYGEFCATMGAFVHHATTERGQSEAVARTLALMVRAFGPFATKPAWADCPGCIIDGWCSND